MQISLKNVRLVAKESIRIRLAKCLARTAHLAPFLIILVWRPAFFVILATIKNSLVNHHASCVREDHFKVRAVSQTVSSVQVAQYKIRRVKLHVIGACQDHFKVRPVRQHARYVTLAHLVGLDSHPALLVSLGPTKI